MNLPVQVDQKQLMDILLNVGTVRPVFIWGSPGIGKSVCRKSFISNFVKKITGDFAKITEKYEVFLNLTIQSIERRPPGGVFCKNLSICAQIAAKRWFDILFRPVYHNI